MVIRKQNKALLYKKGWGHTAEFSKIQSTQRHLVPAWQKQPACHPEKQISATLLQLVCQASTVLSLLLWHPLSDSLLHFCHCRTTVRLFLCSYFSSSEHQKFKKKEGFNLFIILCLTYWLTHRWSCMVRALRVTNDTRDVAVTIAQLAMECG